MLLPPTKERRGDQSLAHPTPPFPAIKGNESANFQGRGKSKYYIVFQRYQNASEIKLNVVNNKTQLLFLFFVFRPKLMFSFSLSYLAHGRSTTSNWRQRTTKIFKTCVVWNFEWIFIQFSSHAIVFFLEVMRSRTERPEGNRKSLITVVTRALEIIMGRKRRKKKIEDRIIHNPTSLSRTFDNKILENKHKLAIFTKFIPHPYLRLHLLLPQKMGQIPLKRIRNC